MRQTARKVNKFWKVLKAILYWSFMIGLIGIIVTGLCGAPTGVASMIGYVVGCVWHYVLIAMIVVGIIRHWIKKGGKKKR